MTAIPDKSLLDNEVRTGSAKTEVLGPIFDVLAESLGGAAVSELTISAGSITPTGASHTVDTGGDAETDDLTNIVYTNHPDGRIIILSCADDSREIVLKHGAGGDGQIILSRSVDLTLEDTRDCLILQRTGTTWREIARSGPSFAGLVFSDVGTIVQAYDANTLKADTTKLLKAAYGDEAQTHVGADLSSLTIDRNHIEWSLAADSTFSNVTLPYDGTYVFHVYPGGYALSLATSYKKDPNTLNPSKSAGEIRIVVEQYNSRKTIVNLQNMGA